jgi:hypothetical protein
MSDELKDFRYYADKAEESIQTSLWAEDEPGQRDRYLKRAAVYAELAKAAPKAEPKRDWPMRDLD